MPWWVLAPLSLLIVLQAACAEQRATRDPETAYPHRSEPIGSLREIYDGVLSPDLAVQTFRNIDRLLPTRTVAPSSHPSALVPDGVPIGAVALTDNGTRYTLDDYVRVNRVAGLLILQHGRIKLERYALGNTQATRWMSMSIAKSITSTLIGAAIRDGLIASLDDSVTRYVPALRGSAYDGVTVREILTMSSGVAWSETYTDPMSDRRRLLDAQLSVTPGSAMRIMAALPRAAPPGTVHNYSTGETQVAAEILRGAVKRPLAEYLSEKIWQPFGMEAAATWWLESAGGTEIGGSGLSATLRDYGRFGLFMLAGGVAGGDSVLPAGWIPMATTARPLRGGNTVDYGFLWWTADSPGDVREHAYIAEGIHGQFIYINPVRDLVIVVWQANPRPVGGSVVDDRAFFRAVADAME